MITEYHRPSSLDEAIGLTARADASVLAGGTASNADRSDLIAAVIDLQLLDLAGISQQGNGIRLGAMVRLQDLVESDLVPDTLRDLAHREAPNTIRNAATIGGTIGAADPNSGLLAGLLAFSAVVTIATVDSEADIPVDDVLADPTILSSGIITEVTIQAGGISAVDRTGRTPMDTPIVSAVARRPSDGGAVLALTGVADRPILVDPNRVADLEPPADFRGSSAYRADLARVLSGRVLAAIEGGA